MAYVVEKAGLHYALIDHGTVHGKASADPGAVQ